MRCPICGKVVPPDAPESALPFCSARCKTIDLKRWADEEYSIETVNEDKLEEEIAQVAPTDGEN
ncbi:MAG: DNA gyrase inhibitor YacG [Thermoguttaceae bacterium]|nr:DNA gyrase inhibitor YacG [Thermoguttaceae bacterium]